MWAVREEEVELRGIGFVKKVDFKPGVMDEQSGESEEKEVIGEVVGESEVEELVPELG